jgi:hypothetical protein
MLIAMFEPSNQINPMQLADLSKEWCSAKAVPIAFHSMCLDGLQRQWKKCC